MNIDRLQHLSVTIDDFKNFFKINKKRENTNLKQIVEDSLNIINVSLVNQNIHALTDFECKENLSLYANELRVENTEDGALFKIVLKV